MLIEQSAYTNSWRRISPAAKGIFTLCGMIAAFAATTPSAACGVAALLSGVTVLGARISLGRYVRVVAPALLFLTVSALTLAVSVTFADSTGNFHMQLARTEVQRVALVCGRSLGGLAALLFLAMTTPLIDIIALLRRLRAPELLLDIMVLCYRTLFVFSESIHDTITAQSARLGYATKRLSMRSLGVLVANISVQVWQRSQALHLTAMARNNDGPLRFLEQLYPNSVRDMCVAVSGGTVLIALVLVKL
ncbi:MAG: cobalt ECF transporter T component CbiQ [Desulfobacteraceae bacterium]|jgi:cobalt/nickel transport system permease protein|nr:MAG: cobalt ECF transporter T component CbiQ [Desulfobacteraceae bacterium]